MLKIINLQKDCIHSNLKLAAKITKVLFASATQKDSLRAKNRELQINPIRT
jgi:hypothetical protein